MKISKDFAFDAAHRLHLVREDHPCRNLHGHRYQITVQVYAVHIDTMVIDYRDLSCIKEWIDGMIDHSTLISKDDAILRQLAEANPEVFGKIFIFPIKETTTELMAEFFQYLFLSILEGRIGFKFGLAVSIKETPNTSAYTDFQISNQPVMRMRGHDEKESGKNSA